MRAQPELDRSAPREREATWGNHDWILELANRQDIPVVFVDYPFWDPPSEPALPRERGRNHAHRGIECLAIDEELPPSARVVRPYEALRATASPPGALFLDNNHLTVRGNEVVGQALAEAIVSFGVGPCKASD